MKNYQLLWENMPETAEEISASVNHLLSLTDPKGEGTIEVVIPLLEQAASFGLTLEALLDSMQEAILNLALSKELH